jgi:acyl-CoA synthetase (AMP-forming)/AMP-acid ligase II
MSCSPVGATAGGFLATGLQRGDRVAVVSPNSVEVCSAILALHRAGLVPAMLNPRLKSGELTALIHDGDMAGCVIAAGLPFAELLHTRLGAKARAGMVPNRRRRYEF